MKAGSDRCLFLPLGDESSEWGSSGDDGGEYDGDLGEKWCRGDGGDDQGMSGSSNNIDLVFM